MTKTFVLLFLFIVSLTVIHGNDVYPSRYLESNVRFRQKPDIKRISEYEEDYDDDTDILSNNGTPIPPLNFANTEETEIEKNGARCSDGEVINQLN